MGGYAGQMGSRIRVELTALSEPRELNSFLRVRFVPEADVAFTARLENNSPQ